MKDFFTTIKNSVWNREFYAVMASRSPKEGFKFFFSLVLAITFVTVVFLSLAVVPIFISSTKFMADLVVNEYPKDLVLVIKNGSASTTVARTFKMTFPTDQVWAKNVEDLRKNNFDNFLVIDTLSSFDNSKQFEEARTFILLTKDKIVASESGGGYKVNPIPREVNLTFTKEFVAYWVAKIMPLIKYIIPFIILLTFVAVYIFAAVFNLFVILISALLIWGIATLTKRGGKFSEFFTTAIFAATLAILSDFVLTLFSLNGLSMFEMVLISVLVWLVNVKIWEKPNIPQTEVVEAPMVGKMS